MKTFRDIRNIVENNETGASFVYGTNGRRKLHGNREAGTQFRSDLRDIILNRLQRKKTKGITTVVNFNHYTQHAKPEPKRKNVIQQFREMFDISFRYRGQGYHGESLSIYLTLERIDSPQWKSIRTDIYSSHMDRKLLVYIAKEIEDAFDVVESAVLKKYAKEFKGGIK